MTLIDDRGPRTADDEGEGLFQSPQSPGRRHWVSALRLRARAPREGAETGPMGTPRVRQAKAARDIRPRSAERRPTAGGRGPHAGAVPVGPWPPPRRTRFLRRSQDHLRTPRSGDRGSALHRKPRQRIGQAGGLQGGPGWLQRGTGRPCAPGQGSRGCLLHHEPRRRACQRRPLRRSVGRLRQSADRAGPRRSGKRGGSLHRQPRQPACQRAASKKPWPATTRRRPSLPDAATSSAWRVVS